MTYSDISDRYCNDVQIFRREDMTYKKIYLRVVFSFTSRNKYTRVYDDDTLHINNKR